MINSLEATPDCLERIEMPDADVLFSDQLDWFGLGNDFFLPVLTDKNRFNWSPEPVTVKIYGRDVPQPRLICFQGDAGISYQYSGITLGADDWDHLTGIVRYKLADICDANVNSVLMNWYRDHNDSIGFHSDDEPELGENPTVVSISFGETRLFEMRHKFDKAAPKIKIPLSNGSLLVMKGETQKYWKHGIKKLKSPCGPRVSLTYRKIIPS